MVVIVWSTVGFTRGEQIVMASNKDTVLSRLCISTQKMNKPKPLPEGARFTITQAFTITYGMCKYVIPRGTTGTCDGTVVKEKDVWRHRIKMDVEHWNNDFIGGPPYNKYTPLFFQPVVMDPFASYTCVKSNYLKLQRNPQGQILKWEDYETYENYWERIERVSNDPAYYNCAHNRDKTETEQLYA